MAKSDRLLFNKIVQEGYKPKNICEIGIDKPEFSNVLGFIQQDIPTTLVEADPDCIKQINNLFLYHKKVNVVEAAVFDFNGTIELCKSESSTFISDLSASPALINDNYQKTKSNSFVAKSILFSEIDNGDFDLISIDIEGAEWYVLKNMISRPNILSNETHGKYYTNPNIAEINNWIIKNNYKIWYKDKSDTVYIKDNLFNIKISEKLQLLITNTKISIIKKKKILKKIVAVFKK